MIGADGLPPGTEPDHLYYDYHPRTLSGGLFVREEWRPAAAVAVTADLAWRHQSYAMRGDRFGGVLFDQSYDFGVPRLGVTWGPRAGVAAFASWAYSSREPAFLNLFNPEAAGSLPNYRERDPAANVYRDPISRPEKASPSAVEFAKSKPLPRNTSANPMNATVIEMKLPSIAHRNQFPNLLAALRYVSATTAGAM